MTALLVILTIVALVCVDAAKLHFNRVNGNKDVVWEPGLGPCMADGLKEDEV